MREVAIISGKGGTGKTTLLLSLVPYLDDLVVADCDVDAPDVHLLLAKDILEQTPFVGFQRPRVDATRCIACGKCVHHCKFGAITTDITIRDGLCEGCGVCEYVCPTQAITLHDHVIGHVFERLTPYGPMIDARLHPGEESSGKLVTAVRERSKALAHAVGATTILIDGAPGIACNVISTLTGVPHTIVVTEPSQSGLHDLKRVVSLARIFHTRLDVVINKADLNPTMTDAIIAFCETEGLDVVLTIPFMPELLDAINDLTIPSLAPIPFFETREWLDFVDVIQKG